MASVKCEFVDGLASTEKIARIRTISGVVEEVPVASKYTNGGSLEVGKIGRESNRVLIELPRESLTGRWRLWVDGAQVIED